MAVEVKTKLTLDDAASASLSHLREGFEELHESSQQTQEGLTAMKLVLTELATRAFEVGIDKAKEFGESLIEAASGGQQVQQRIAGMTAAVQGTDWDTAKESAVGYFEKVQDIAIETRQPIEDVEAGYARLVEIQGATPEGLGKSLEQTREMAKVANVLGTSVETIGGQFAFMEEGALKVKSQMYQLLQPTGIFKNGTEKVTEWWSKLTNESRAALLAEGLEKLSGRMEQAAPTFKDTETQLDNMWTTMKERLGEPIIDALQPQIQRLEKSLSGGSKEFDKFAQELGVHVGEWVDEAANDVKEGFQFLKDNQAEIAADIKEAWAFAKEVMEFIIRHKEVLAAIAIGRSELGKGAIGAVQGVAGAVLKSAPTTIGGAEIAAFTGSAIALGSFTAAIGASILALQQWDDLMKVTGGGKSDERLSFEAEQRAFKDMLTSPDVTVWGKQQQDQFTHMRENIVRMAADLDEDARAAGELADQAYAAHHAARALLDPVDKAASALQAMSQAADKDWSQQDAAVAAITTGFSNAASAHNAAAQQYIATLLAGSTELQTAFLQSATMSADGFNSLADMLQESSKSFAEQLRGKAALAGGAAKEAKPTINFNGGQSFKINQEFRDADPDRIAIVFQNGILRSAERRIQAATAMPFGA